MKLNRLLGTVPLLMVLGCQAGMPVWERVATPWQAPDFTLQQLDGGQVSLHDFRGRVVIMEFWASWCGPCRMSTPSLEQVYREYRHQNMVVLLINAGETPDIIKRWTTHQRFTAPILLDTHGAVRELYQVKGIPRLLIVDQDGLVLYDKSGYGGALERSLKVILDELLLRFPRLDHTHV